MIRPEEKLAKMIMDSKRYAYKVSGNKNDGDDLLQDAYLLIHPRLHTIDPRNLRNYVSRTIYHLHVNKTKGKGRGTMKEDLMDSFPEDFGYWDENTGLNRLHRQDAIKLVKQLPAERRRLYCCHLNGWSLGDLSERFGKKENTIKHEIWRNGKLLAAQAGS